MLVMNSRGQPMVSVVNKNGKKLESMQYGRSYGKGFLVEVEYRQNLF